MKKNIKHAQQLHKHLQPGALYMQTSTQPDLGIKQTTFPLVKLNIA